MSNREEQERKLRRSRLRREGQAKTKSDKAREGFYCTLCGKPGAAVCVWSPTPEVARDLGIAPGQSKKFGYILCRLHAVNPIPYTTEIEDKLIEQHFARAIKRQMTPEMQRQADALMERDECLLCGGPNTTLRVWPPPPELFEKLGISPDQNVVFPITVCPTCVAREDAPERIADAVVARSRDKDRRATLKLFPAEA